MVMLASPLRIPLGLLRSSLREMNLGGHPPSPPRMDSAPATPGLDLPNSLRSCTKFLVACSRVAADRRGSAVRHGHGKTSLQTFSFRSDGRRDGNWRSRKPEAEGMRLHSETPAGALRRLLTLTALSLVRERELRCASCSLTTENWEPKIEDSPVRRRGPSKSPGRYRRGAGRGVRGPVAGPSRRGRRLGPGCASAGRGWSDCRDNR